MLPTPPSPLVRVVDTVPDPPLVGAGEVGQIREGFRGSTRRINSSFEPHGILRSVDAFLSLLKLLPHTITKACPIAAARRSCWQHVIGSGMTVMPESGSSWRGLDGAEPNGRIGTCCCVAQNRLWSRREMRAASLALRCPPSPGALDVNPYRGPRAAECLKEFCEPRCLRGHRQLRPSILPWVYSGHQGGDLECTFRPGDENDARGSRTDPSQPGEQRFGQNHRAEHMEAIVNSCPCADSVRLAGSAPALWTITSTLVRLEPIFSPSVQTSLRSDRSQRHTTEPRLWMPRLQLFPDRIPLRLVAHHDAPPRRGQPKSLAVCSPSPMMLRSQQRLLSKGLG